MMGRVVAYWSVGVGASGVAILGQCSPSYGVGGVQILEAIGTNTSGHSNF